MSILNRGRVYGRGGFFVAMGVLLLLLAGLAVVQWLLDRWSLGVSFRAYMTPGRIIANAVVGFGLFLFLAALTRRLFLPFVLVAMATGGFYLVSAIKYRLLGMPVMLQDVHFLTALDQSSLQLFSSYVDVTWQLVCGVLAVLVFILALFLLERCWCKPRSWGRCAVALVSLLWLGGLWMVVWPWNSGPYAIAEIRPSRLSALPAALHGGLAPSLIYYRGQQRNRRLAVDEGSLRQVLAWSSAQEASQNAPVVAADGNKRDVIIILSESFMDPRVLKGMESVPDVIPNMRAALTGGYGGMMLAPTFGGGTVRTEFEVLTGMPVEAFENVYYPYVDLDVSVMPGIVSELKRQGYRSFAVHGNAGSFWNRTSTYKAMGVERFITLREMMKTGAFRDGEWVADSSMTDILIDELGKASAPSVAVSISMEAHGPYTSQTQVKDEAAWAAIKLPPGLDDSVAFQLRNYLYHLNNADKELGRLLAALKQRGRPFELLFFGDHLPAFEGVYEKLGFVDGRDATQQYVPWLIASDDATKVQPSFAYTWELPALVLKDATGDQGKWFRQVHYVGEQLRNGPSLGRDKDALLRGLNAGANARISGTFDAYAE